jgi:hypothetical protein
MRATSMRAQRTRKTGRDKEECQQRSRLNVDHDELQQCGRVQKKVKNPSFRAKGKHSEWTHTIEQDQAVYCNDRE